MSERFIRCVHCSLPHNAHLGQCPKTARPLPPSRAAPGLPIGRPAKLQPASDRLRVGPPPLPVRALARAVPCPAPPPPPPPLAPCPEAALLGRTITNKYLVRAILGEGGMAVVFDALHLQLGCQVALKVLRAAHAKRDTAVERLRREGRVVAQLGHPNVCAVHDVGALDDGRPYLVMERLVGQTLAQRIGAAGRLPESEAVDILMQMLAALGAAHAQGIVHRDVKPDNVFLLRGPNGPPIVKVLDFGAAKNLLARPEIDGPDLTTRGMVMGTPHYMAPEQARGERGVDARLDLYACGVVLYEALTGRRPFSAENHAEVLQQVVNDEPRPARAFRPMLSPSFDEVLRRAMARRAETRYRTAAEFQEALRGLGKAQLVVAPPRHGPDLGPSRLSSPPVHVDAHPTKVWERNPFLGPEEDAAATRVMDRRALLGKQPPFPGPLALR